MGSTFDWSDVGGGGAGPFRVQRQFGYYARCVSVWFVTHEV